MRWILVVMVAAAVGGAWGPGGESKDTAETTAPAESVSVAEPETVATATRGILYLFGNRIEPPYLFVIHNDTLWVNDYFFMGKQQPKQKSKRDSLADAMHESVYEVASAMLDRGASYDSVLLKAAGLYEGFDVVDSARVLSGRLYLWQSHDRHPPVEVLIPRYPLPTPTPFLERLRGEARLLAALLDMGGIEIRGSKFSLSVPAQDLARAEALIEKIKKQGSASEEDERGLHAPPGKLEELIIPRPLKKRGEKQ